MSFSLLSLLVVSNTNLISIWPSASIKCECDYPILTSSTCWDMMLVKYYSTIFQLKTTETLDFKDQWLQSKSTIAMVYGGLEIFSLPHSHLRPAAWVYPAGSLCVCNTITAVQDTIYFGGWYPFWQTKVT